MFDYADIIIRWLMLIVIQLCCIANLIVLKKKDYGLYPFSVVMSFLLIVCMFTLPFFTTVKSPLSKLLDIGDTFNWLTLESISFAVGCALTLFCYVCLGVLYIQGKKNDTTRIN